MDSDPTKQEGYEELQQDAAAADGGGYNESNTTQGRNKRNVRTRQENAETTAPHKIDYFKLAKGMVDKNPNIKPATPKTKQDDGPDL